MSDLIQASLAEIRARLAGGDVSAEAVAKACLDRIAETEPSIHALITVREQALEEARALDAQGPDASKPLWGVPVTVKDAIVTKGTRTTAGSKILSGFNPFYDAFVVERLKEAGAVIVGKNNMDEFAMGSSTENSHFKPTKNPFDTERIPGGSSGGSAAAVAAREAIVTLGSDTGGSIRQPASYCGVVGLKPTYGSVSRYGLVAFASSLDQIGPLGKCVKDVAMVQSAIVGHDKYDATSSYREYPDFAADLKADVKGLRIGIPKEYFGDGIDPFVKQSVMNAVKELEKQGATVKEISLPSTDYALSSYYIISSAEASSNLARFDGVRYGFRAEEYDGLVDMYERTRSEGFGEEVKRRILLGNYCLSSGYYDAYYRKAMALRQLIRKEYNDIFEKCDVILTPTTPAVAYSPEMTSDPVQMYQADICTVTVNIAGLPAISTPCGYDSKGMPIGMSVIGRKFDEATIIKTADAYEKGFKPVAPKL